jgi:hypothetical protein
MVLDGWMMFVGHLVRFNLVSNQALKKSMLCPCGCGVNSVRLCLVCTVRVSGSLLDCSPVSSLNSPRVDPNSPSFGMPVLTWVADSMLPPSEIFVPSVSWCLSLLSQAQIPGRGFMDELFDPLTSQERQSQREGIPFLLEAHCFSPCVAP